MQGGGVSAFSVLKMYKGGKVKKTMLDVKETN
jgi:hypothetical protein